MGGVFLHVEVVEIRGSAAFGVVTNCSHGSFFEFRFFTVGCGLVVDPGEDIVFEGNGSFNASVCDCGGECTRSVWCSDSSGGTTVTSGCSWMNRVVGIGKAGD